MPRGLFSFLETQMEGMSNIDCVRTRQETAEMLRISLRTLRRLEVKGDLPPRIRISERIFGYRDSQINAYLASRTATV
jgi:predicted DNA-binding transcriptional regulator AlpA